MNRSLTTTARSLFAAGTLLLGSAAFAACGSDSDGLAIDGVWSRTSPAMSSAGVVYFEITSDVDDQLTGVAVDSSIAAQAQIHETTMVADDAMEGMEDDDAMEGMEDDGAMAGTMTMAEVSSITVAKGETVVFEPGGFHVMLLDLAEPLEKGQEFDITLSFATAEDQVVHVTVRDSAPSN